MIANLEDIADAADGDLNSACRVPPRLTKREINRLQAILPGGTPRYVRCYDNGGATIDCFTVVFTGKAGGKEFFPYLAMNSAPFHPQGFGQHVESGLLPCDVNGWGFAPAIGRKCHLGKRIPFADLPADCRKLVLQDYLEIWNLKGGVL